MVPATGCFRPAHIASHVRLATLGRLNASVSLRPSCGDKLPALRGFGRVRAAAAGAYWLGGPPLCQCLTGVTFLNRCSSRSWRPPRRSRSVLLLDKFSHWAAMRTPSANFVATTRDDRVVLDSSGLLGSSAKACEPFSIHLSEACKGGGDGRALKSRSPDLRVGRHWPFCRRGSRHGLDLVLRAFAVTT